MGASSGPRLSGMQKQVLALYRGFLRAARSKPPEERSRIKSIVSSEFHHNSSQIDRKNFLYIEYLLRRGKKQLDQLNSPDTVGLSSLNVKAAFGQTFDYFQLDNLKKFRLPMVLTIAEAQEKNDFELSSLPALVPVFNSASGETLLLLVKHAELIINKASQEHLISHVLPMLVLAYDDTDARLQEEVLKKTILLAKQLDAQIVKQALLPRVHGLALKTTVAVVRVNALLCLSDMVRILDKNAVLDILQTIQQCTAVDHSAPTLMCTLGVANSILKQFGIEFVAEYVLPLLIPLLITQQLNVQQFAKHMLFVKDVLRKIEEQRGVALTDGGISEVRPLPAAERSTLGQMNKTATNTPSTTKRNFWDEDWIPGKVASTAVQSLSITSNTQPAIPSQPVQVNSRYDISSMASVTSNQELPSACAAVDVEWPPRSSSGVTAQYDEIEMLNGNKGPPSDSRLNIIDPFANWPPRPSATPSVSNSFNNGMTASSVNNFELSNSATTNGLSFQSGSWAFGLQNSSVSNSQNQGTGKSPNVDSVSSGGLNSQKSLGYMKQNHGISALGSSHERTADLGSIFATNKNDQIAPRLAPPPTTVVGKVRGGRGSQGQVRSSQIKSKTDQPPLLDLL